MPRLSNASSAFHGCYSSRTIRVICSRAFHGEFHMTKPTGYWTEGKGRDRIVHPEFSSGRGRRSRKMANVAKSGIPPMPESQLHPFVSRPSRYEPVLTTSQKLTPAQKEHLDEFQDRDSLLSHLSSFHGQTFSGETESQQSHPIDPEVRKRFGLPDRPLTSLETLQLRHLQEHLENIEERVRTAPERGPLAPQEYEKAGVSLAPGFEEK